MTDPTPTAPQTTLPPSFEPQALPQPSQSSPLEQPPAPKISLHQPILLPPNSNHPPQSSQTRPTLSWLEGTWHVTHSTLPMWKKSRNVRITYARIPGTSSPSSPGVHLSDEVRYQSRGSTKIKTVKGVDKPMIVEGNAEDGGGGRDGKDGGEDNASLSYQWRGSGWLFVASSKWEILGFGDEQGSENRWVVTLFAKTIFTPAGIDIYSRAKEGLREETVEKLKGALKGLGGSVAKLAGELFEIKRDGDGELVESG